MAENQELLVGKLKQGNIMEGVYTCGTLKFINIFNALIQSLLTTSLQGSGQNLCLCMRKLTFGEAKEFVQSCMFGVLLTWDLTTYLLRLDSDFSVLQKGRKDFCFAIS